jgi:hypothetical protein
VSDEDLVADRLATRDADHPARARAPVLAFCGLAGGVGTTSLTIATAHAASGKVLLAEAESCCGGLIAHGCDGLGLSLAGLIEIPMLESLDGRDGVRVLAGPARELVNVRTPRRHDAIIEAVAELRRAHDAIVLDCGTLRAFDARLMLGLATHVVWVVAAETVAAVRGEGLLRSDACPDLGTTPQAVAAVAVRRRMPVAGRIPALRRLARRHGRLVLVPHASLDPRTVRAEAGPLASTLTALLGFAGLHVFPQITT